MRNPPKSHRNPMGSPWNPASHEIPLETGWWFGAFSIFPYFHTLVMEKKKPTDEIIFFRGLAQPPTRKVPKIIAKTHEIPMKSPLFAAKLPSLSPPQALLEKTRRSATVRAVTQVEAPGSGVRAHFTGISWFHLVVWENCNMKYRWVLSLVMR